MKCGEALPDLGEVTCGAIGAVVWSVVDTLLVLRAYDNFLAAETASSCAGGYAFGNCVSTISQSA